MKQFKRVFKIVWFTFVAIFFVWMWSTFQSHNLPDDTFQNTDKISVLESDDKITFLALNSIDSFEVIFFQGGLTDPKAYAPLCRQLAKNGFTTHLIKMAFRMPQNDYKKINGMFDLSSGKFIIGGHSQGGKMAAQYVYENPGKLKGLFLLGTSHPRDIDLSNQSIPCLKLYAEHDGLASMKEVLENKAFLPPNANLVLIEGGNHSQFGYLGKLFMDDRATIKIEAQQQIISDQLINFLNGLKENGSNH